MKILEMKTKFILCAFVAVLSTSCLSTKSTLQNVDDSAKVPELLDKETYKLTDFSKNEKYAYDEDYPVNVGFGKLADGPLNERRFLNALAGPKGEKITYTRIGSCCPFPSNKSELGGGLIDQYEIVWEGQTKPVTLYLNMYEKGKVEVPVGFTLKKK
ncbi:2-dehydro-3-deoxyphosphooctonate aldolase [Flavobacterium kingsejongi]|nr:2-dehydro-3-deoxyphosphooctonate aldolase [Flavobacterium kingsejongi]